LLAVVSKNRTAAMAALRSTHGKGTTSTAGWGRGSSPQEVTGSPSLTRCERGSASSPQLGRSLRGQSLPGGKRRLLQSHGWAEDWTQLQNLDDEVTFVRRWDFISGAKKPAAPLRPKAPSCAEISRVKDSMRRSLRSRSEAAHTSEDIKTSSRHRSLDVDSGNIKLPALAIQLDVGKHEDHSSPLSALPNLLPRRMGSPISLGHLPRKTGPLPALTLEVDNRKGSPFKHGQIPTPSRNVGIRAARSLMADFE